MTFQEELIERERLERERAEAPARQSRSMERLASSMEAIVAAQAVQAEATRALAESTASVVAQLGEAVARLAPNSTRVESPPDVELKRTIDVELNEAKVAEGNYGYPVVRYQLPDRTWFRWRVISITESHGPIVEFAVINPETQDAIVLEPRLG